jgi:hypothetical protein
MPTFSWVQTLIADKEQGTNTCYCLAEMDNNVFEIVSNGISILFPEEPEGCEFDWTFPGTNEPLTGNQLFTFPFYMKRDGKMVLWLNGSKRANTRHPSPYVKLSKESLMNPILNSADLCLQDICIWMLIVHAVFYVHEHSCSF